MISDERLAGYVQVSLDVQVENKSGPLPRE